MTLLLALLVACSGGDTAETDTIVPLEPPPPGAGFQLEMTATAPAYDEIWICEVYALPTSETQSVNWVEFQQNAGTHHMTLSSPGLSGGEIEHGTYDCADLYGDSSVMENQIMFFGGQGDADGELHLPDGVAAQFPPSIDVIHEVHYVNPTDQPVELYSRVNAWTIPDDDVEKGIWGGQARDENIEIPPESTHTEWSRCVMTEDVEVHFLASHTHALGTEFTVKRFDGETVSDDIIYINDDWHSPLIQQFEPPLVVPAGTGFEYSCTWKNNASEPVGYGLAASDEMCNLAYVHTPMALTNACKVVATSDGVLPED